MFEIIWYDKRYNNQLPYETFEKLEMILINIMMI